MISHLDSILVASLFVLLGIVELAMIPRATAGRRRDDWLIDILSVSQFALFIKPGIAVVVGFLLTLVSPAHAGSLSSIPIGLGILLVLVPGDFMHYWYHRKGHEWEWLWRRHRTHHTSPTMGVTVSFRENWQWFALMPDLWYGAALVYLGLGEAVVISTLIVGVHDILIHTAISWDRPLYRWTPLAYFLERLIQLPSTHRAHHAVENPDGEIPNENFGQTFFLWDSMFGTARFPRGVDPKSYGIRNDPQDSWYTQLWSTAPEKARAIDLTASEIVER